MPLFVGKNPETNEECQIEFNHTASIEDAKTQICDRLGVESKKYNLVYRGEILLYHKSLQELDLADDPRPVLCVTRIIKPAKPISAFSLLGLPGLGSRVASANVPETENEEESKLPHPFPKYTEAGLLDDPRNFSIAKNSSFAYRVHAMTRNDYSQEDGEKLMENITSDIQRIVDSLTYDELEKLAVECLQINRLRTEGLRNQYYTSYENRAS